jgi:hypothetical protein
VSTLASIYVTSGFLRDLCQAYVTDKVDRRTYIRERRRLIDEAVAGNPSAPPAIPEDFQPEATVVNLDATMQLIHRVGEDDE